jgi:hypothetical protein
MTCEGEVKHAASVTQINNRPHAFGDRGMQESGTMNMLISSQR